MDNPGKGENGLACLAGLTGREIGTLPEMTPRHVALLRGYEKLNPHVQTALLTLVQNLSRR